jgi:hypothetical protein
VKEAPIKAGAFGNVPPSEAKPTALLTIGSYEQHRQRG